MANVQCTLSLLHYYTYLSLIRTIKVKHPRLSTKQKPSHFEAVKDQA